MKALMRAATALVISCFVISPTLSADDAITEAEAVRLFLEKSPQARAVPLARESVEAELLTEALVSNPDLAYEVEDTPGARDEFLTIEQELPLTGRHGLLRDRAAAASNAAGLAAERELQAQTHALRLAFYEVLYHEASLGSLRAGLLSLTRTVAILREREREGESSGYDLLRAEQELAELQIAEAAAESTRIAARARFGSFFDASRQMEAASLSGELQAVGPPVGDAVELALAQRSDLRALTAEAEGLELERKASRRERFPRPALTAGWKRTEAAGFSEDGFVAGLTLSLPVFDRGQHAAARAAAEKERVELQGEILEREIRAEVRAALALERAARERSQRYGNEVDERGAELRRIAQLAYDEGESGILELLDAHRTALSMELRALEARFDARRASIELDRVLGSEVKP